MGCPRGVTAAWARGKQGGFSPGAAALHSISAAIHTDGSFGGVKYVCEPSLYFAPRRNISKNTFSLEKSICAPPEQKETAEQTQLGKIANKSV